MVRRIWDTVKAATAETELTSLLTLATTSNQVLGVAQFVSRPLAAQTIPGTMASTGAQIKARESTTNANFNRIPWMLKLVSNNGATLRKVLVAINITAMAEFGTTATNRKPVPLSMQLMDDSVDLVVTAGDRLVLEVGIQNTTATAIGERGWLTAGDASATDLPVDTTDTGAKNPWFETDYDFVFQALATGHPLLSSIGAG